MKCPCEVNVWYVLPSIRSELTKELLKLGLVPKEVSEKLEITPAAVSQYSRGKRGKSVKFEKDVKGLIRTLARDIAKDDSFGDLIPRVCEICKRV